MQREQPDTDEEASPIDSPRINLGVLGRLFQLQRGTLRTNTQLLQLLQIQMNEDDDDDPDDDDDDYEPAVTNQESRSWLKPATEPQEAGVELLNSGEYGRIAPKIHARRGERNLVKVITNRFTGRRPTLFKEDLITNLVPNSNGSAMASYNSNIYTAQYSTDSSFYYTCSQDFRLYIYDSSSPPFSTEDRQAALSDTSVQTTMNIRRRIRGHPGRWTITDANLSPDNQRMIYSSLTSTVYMTSTIDDTPTQVPIPFGSTRTRRRDSWNYDEEFNIYACRFSADGNEVIAGGSNLISVYDLLANRRIVHIKAHTDDVNSCCWADTASGNVLVSASDDSSLKVWDRRSLGAAPKPSGVLMGHTEGITYVSAKGDGRYVISNGKDQALRLWDLRKMRSSLDYDNAGHRTYGFHFDYRYPPYPKPKRQAHPMDCSVMTYRGHSVLRTLIRCHFSPAETTGSQYIYSGSADGNIHIWSLDGTVVQILDRNQTLPIGHDPSAPERLSPPRHTNRRVCVRDVSWHSQEPVMMSAGWDSGRGGSILARHEWKGLSKMSGSLEDWVAREESERHAMENVRRSSRLATQRRRDFSLIPGAYLDGDEYDEDEYY
ncbi:WD40-repeat-containing domain protein [Desarmillaria tabescens]|uniref:WD40-repeat-containing domain protein n=1 Tax=Armillaria tabescens TaxID=1929756 RepID=A0AA39NGZ4_ARMTA|nr:WD40-repeat-containing domain protein [Desarmillaria tabescens]KAK0465467.1 WD40-repeat-containing domain protein [Desarmillaria tabescens]